MKVINMKTNAPPQSTAFAIPTDTYLVIPHAHASGGIERQRRVTNEERIGANGEKVESMNVQIVADVGERDRAEGIANRAKGAVMRHLQYTPLGYLADASALAALDRDLAPILADADRHNASARHSFATCQILRVKLDKNIGPAEIDAIRSRVSDELTAMRDALRNGDAKGYRLILQRSPNLSGLCFGVVKMQVDAALAQCDVAAESLRENARARAAAERKGHTAPQLLDPSTLDLGQLDTAIELVS